MKGERKDFCVNCRKEVSYHLEKKTVQHVIREKNYQFVVTTAICDECGEEVAIPGLLDLINKEIDAQYRKVEDLVTIDDINKLMEIYKLGKSTLSLALGFGEITITRYLLGQMPSIEYSNTIKRALQSPKFMIENLNLNRKKIGEKAYKKAMFAAKELNKLFMLSDKLLGTISYIFEKTYDITPLALQKILYYIQALYITLFNQSLYEEDCFAWIHGPVYTGVYELFKSFKAEPIEDERFVILKNRFGDLNDEEKLVIDLVLDTFGRFSGKTLEILTHHEDPWMNARKGYLYDEPSNVVITKEVIKDYFISISHDYDLGSKEGILQYINQILN